MKKIFSSVMLFAAAAMAFVSCQKQETLSPASQEITLTFASEKPAFVDETKTEWTGEGIRWSKGDKISVAYTVDGNWQNALGNASGDAKLYKSEELKASAETAQFNVSAYFEGATAGTHIFYGVYPAPSETNFSSAPVATVTVASIQNPKADSFDSSADLMVGVSSEYDARPAKGETISLKWNRLVAHAVITLKDINGLTDQETIENVTITAQSDANLVGSQKLNLLTKEIVKNNASANTLKIGASKLNVNNKSLTFWAAILPETITDLTVEVETDKATYTRQITGISKEFKQNARNTLVVKMGDAIRTEKIVDNSLVTDVLNRALTGVSGTAYKDWSGKTSISEAVYAGQSAGGNEAIQLRSSNSNSGIVTTTSGGYAKKVAVEWNNNTTNGRTLNVYGSSTAYTAPTDLYNNAKCGTKLGTIVCGTSTELTIDGEYEYIGLRSNSGAMYLDEIQISWSKGGVETPEPEPDQDQDQDQPSELDEITVAQFLELKNTATEYTLTGKITSVANTTYGNFDLTDATGTVYVYGLLTPEGASQKQWAAAGLKQGDVITVKGKYNEYNNSPQVKNAVYVSHKGINVDKSALAFDAKGGSLDITASLVNATEPISVSVDNSHFSVALKSGTTYTVTAPANNTEEEIYANLTFSAGDLTAVVAISQEKPADADEVAGGRDDFNTVTATSSYGSRTTTAGWTGTNCAVMQGGTSDSNPTFNFIGATSATRAFTMNGKTSAKGKITSPTLTTGCGTLSLKYGHAFSESNGVNFTVTIKQNGTEVESYNVKASSITQKKAYTWEQEVNVAGDFVIEITNNSPSNSSSNKDRVSIWDVEWTGYAE